MSVRGGGRPGAGDGQPPPGNRRGQRGRGRAHGAYNHAPPDQPPNAHRRNHGRGRGGRNQGDPRGRPPDDTDHDRQRPGGATRGIKHYSYDDLKHLAVAGPSEVVKCFNENEPGFFGAYKYPRNCSNPRILKCLIKMLYQLTKSNEEALASRVLAQILSQEGDFALFMFHLDQLLKQMPMETRGFVKQENPQYLNYLVELGFFAIEHVPESVATTFPRIVLSKTIQDLIAQGEELDSLLKRTGELNTQFDTAMDDLIRKRQPAESVPDDKSHQQPPEHFTTVDVLPTAEAIQQFEKPFLRSNITRGGYEDWDHYLDVQYRLLREDFVAPLRNGIQGCCGGLPQRKLSEVRIYHRIRVLTPVCLFSGIGFQIYFNTIASHLGRVNWEHSRRLIFGSLLCLSNDDFQTVMFATVVKRDPKLLKEGLLVIKFEGDVNGFEIDPSTEFTMVESTAYFEAYRHVLEGLKKVSGNAGMMPFKPYIVECKMQEIPPPSYIRSTESVSFDMNKALGMKSSKPRVKITDPCSWPHVDETNLDKSQLDAVQMALRQEISVIQGPPGTGKTYIGLKIVQAFLQNRKVWDRFKNSPILVVCYTNHALDQFLEGIKECEIDGKEPDIIRIGGRCKSENLATCVLAEKVQSCRSQKSFPARLYKEFFSSRNDMYRLKQQIDEGLQELDNTEKKILKLSTLERAISEHHKLQFSGDMHTEVGKEIEVWLGLWYPRPPTPDESSDDEDEALATAIRASLSLEEPSPNQGAQPPPEQEDLDPNADDGSDADFIEVDEEARLLQEDRVMEGEEIELTAPEGAQAHIQHEDLEQPTHKVDPYKWQVKTGEKERKKKIHWGFRHKAFRSSEANKIDDIYSLNERDRWRLYHHWANKYLNHQKRQLSRLAPSYNDRCDDHNEKKEHMNVYVLQGADVIGMTTTGAAKHHYILKNIHPKIVIVEEAAEVFESHIVTSLSPSVQQLILIGDHQQLKPKPNYYELEKKYSFAVSLFERLTLNNIPYTTLKVQHRMRPEIAQLVCPHIYPELLNHGSVEKYEHIDGIGKNLFFIDHTYPEESNPDGDMRSHSNNHEAEYLVALCRYLLKQGYKPSQITLLTMYRGQLLNMKKRMHRADFEGVRVSAVDDFQGEENDIILLSLVRSNSDSVIGFLKIPNRVCVSLSRARKGLYVIGNLSVLRSRDDTIWPTILADMDQKRCTGIALPLYCQIHPEEKVGAKTAEDFSKRPEGGCTKKCIARLKCGHQCTRLCHPYDRNHELYKCRKQCTKMLACGHSCGAKCYECTKKCPPCQVLVPKIIPSCGHLLSLPCHTDPYKVKCHHQCSQVLQCGHLCQEVCCQPCTVHCPVIVEKSLPCGHKIEASCYRSPNKIRCPRPCKAQLDCGHRCAGTCGKCWRGRLHVPCQHKCNRSLFCGHLCDFPCTANCPPCTQPCTNFCVHSKCPNKCYEPCSPCMEPCKWRCEHLQCTHRCGEMCNRPRCNQPCTKRLPCGHPCIGLCGEECVCRECNEEVSDIFFGTEDEDDARFIKLTDCGHILEVSGLDHWVDATEESNAVQLKCCPKCKKPIRRSLRYGNIIKQYLRDVEQIKQKQLVPTEDKIKQQFKDVRREISTLKNAHCVRKEMEKIQSVVHPPLDEDRNMRQQQYLFPHRTNAICNQLTFLPQVVKLYDTLDLPQRTHTSCQFSSIPVGEIHGNIEVLQEFLMQEFLSDQQLSDFECELRRLACTTKLCDLGFKLKQNDCQVTASDRANLQEVASKVFESGWCEPKMTPQLEHEVMGLISNFSKRYKVVGLSEAERREIVKAIGLSTGHWFKCPNGHFYCIGDCGGAMQIAQCPDCKAQIGGQNHQLLPGNALAPEVDGAQYAAWSDQANLLNYDLDELQA